MTSEHHCLAPVFELYCDSCNFGSHNQTDHSGYTQWKQLGAKEPKVSILKNILIGSKDVMNTNSNIHANAV